jgi:hypothetical protein
MRLKLTSMIGILALGTVAILLITMPNLCIGSTQSPAAPPVLVVRGYIAASVGATDRPFTHVPLRVPPRRDIYLPGIEVYLLDLLNVVKDVEPVRTDLSGRFTLRAQKTSRYQVCWRAEGFIESCSEGIIPANPGFQHVGTLRISPTQEQDTTVVFGKVAFKDGSFPRMLEPLANINSSAQVTLLDSEKKSTQKGSCK